jgi:hypothetical protein
MASGLIIVSIRNRLVISQYSGTTRVSRRCRNSFAAPGVVNRLREAWTMTKPEMTKKMSTPALQGMAR